MRIEFWLQRPNIGASVVNAADDFDTGSPPITKNSKSLRVAIVELIASDEKFIEQNRWKLVKEGMHRDLRGDRTILPSRISRHTHILGFGPVFAVEKARIANSDSKVVALCGLFLYLPRR